MGSSIIMKSLSLAILMLPLLATRLWSEPPTPDIPALELKAKDGDAAAQFALARAYYRGLGVKKDAVKSAELLEKSAVAGNAEAMDGLGFLYTKGEGVPLDEAKAVEWFRKGAEAGWAKSQLHLGLMLRQGENIELSNEESLTWIQKAADGGLMEAKAVLGRLYFTGDKLQMPSPQKAVPYLREAAESGDPICENMMGMICRDGTGEQARDKEAAKEWFRKAAMRNNRKAQSNYAQILGVESPASPDRKEALKWLLIAMQQGEFTAEKTYKEILVTIPAPLLAAAQQAADEYLIIEKGKATQKESALPQPASPAVQK